LGIAHDGENGWRSARSKRPDTTDPKWFVDYNYYNPSGFDFHLNGPSSAFLHSSVAPLAAGWNQFTLAKDASVYSFYLNGVSIGSQTFAGTFPDPASPFTLGYAEGGHDFSGCLDEVVLYNRALTASEAQVLAGIEPIPEPATMLLLGAGIACLAGAGRRGRRR
jgi:hypothetical protein